MTDDSITRRTALLAAGAVGLAAGSAAAAVPPPVDTGTISGGALTFPPDKAATEVQPAPPSNPDPRDDRVGFAVVGLGKLATENILPGFARSKHARVTALVSGSPDKMALLAKQYGVAADSCYSYAEMAKLRQNSAVQAAYIVTPNALHRRDVSAAAAAGKHVLCEKPRAISSREARAMVAACAHAGVKLMIAYRMQYQPHLREAVRLARDGALGDVTLMDMVNTQNQGDPGQWRQKRALAGGGSLPDVGLYCLNTSRAILGEEPVAVTATIWSPAGDPRFAEVEDNVAFTLHFPSGATSNCLTSYSTHELRRLKLIGTTGWLEMDNAFSYEGQRLKVSRTVDGRDEIAERIMPARNQFALELDHFAECVRSGRTPRTPGEEGVQDHVVMEAIYATARSGRRVDLPRIAQRDAFRGPETADAST